jgi:Domain of unknown function (DUF4177)
MEEMRGGERMWEYRVVTEGSAGALEDELNRLAQEGWEVVTMTVLHQPPTGTAREFITWYVIAKRRKGPEHAVFSEYPEV